MPKIGQAHGINAREMINRSIAFYQKMFAHTCKMDWETVRTIAKDWQGISDSAETALINILILNIRTEIAFGMFNDGCTNLYWKTKGNTFLAQNWDWMEDQKQNLIILDIVNDKIPRIKMVTEAGIIGKIGLNELGVGVCLNAIKVPGCDTTRIPVHLALRLVLESSSANHAVQQLEKVGLAASAHLLIGDKEKALGLKSSAKTMMFITEDERGQILHANHLLLQHEGSVDAGWLADSPCRQRRIQELATMYGVSTDREPCMMLFVCWMIMMDFRIRFVGMRRAPWDWMRRSLV
ncbi:hypothetical protein N7493_007674 [Penicillium malachiteum]|uniref:Peptidase C45 hydrolase domain-containing protein n=1 Tax=Penicillium malachiteum TaxID=1324776 RepID=A0AAD6HI46_9EURO|nr:hypothetical protein N7493_007674 [Penicillium malachiteum]